MRTLAIALALALGWTCAWLISLDPEEADAASPLPAREVTERIIAATGREGQGKQWECFIAPKPDGVYCCFKPWEPVPHPTLGYICKVPGSDDTKAPVFVKRFNGDDL